MSERATEVVIKWVSEDVQTLRPDLTLDECEDLLASVGKHLQDRSIELGWDVLRDLIPPEPSPTSIKVGDVLTQEQVRAMFAGDGVVFIGFDDEEE